jgi:hypothetical protein
MPDTYLSHAARGARTMTAVCAIIGEHGTSGMDHVLARLDYFDALADLLALREMLDNVIDLTITANQPDNA